MGTKTLWEKKKLLVTSNFFFSCSVFERLVLQTRKNQGLFGKGLYGTYKQNFNFLFTFILSPANAFNLDQLKILLFGKELRKMRNYMYNDIDNNTITTAPVLFENNRIKSSSS